MGLKDMLFGEKEDANKVAYRDEGRAVQFKFRSVENADFIGLLIARGLNPAKFGPGGEETESLDFS